jgi:hypothetical protein
VIDNYTVGANDPELIDSISKVSLSAPRPEAPVIAKADPPRPSRGTVFIPAPPQKEEPQVVKESPPVTVTKAPPVITPPLAGPPKPLTVEDKFHKREKKLNAEIPVWGDSIELRFYDNAQVDGDSISLFLGDKLLFTHVRLTDKAYSIKLPVADIGDSADLTMVAENLGSIPPNTSYMVVMVGGKRHEAFLASTEQSSAVVRLRKTVK